MATVAQTARWLVAVMMVASSCQSASSTSVLLEHEAHGVRTSVILDESNASPQVRATFTPIDDGWHLYSKDLPADGVSGIGRPTRVAVTGGLIMAGPVSTDSVPFELTVSAIDEPVPIYEDGPVELRVPVGWRLDSTDDVQVSIGYMACATDGGCRRPVDHTVTVSLGDAP